MHVIKSRHQAVACFSKFENLTSANTMHNHLKGVKNVSRILANMNAGKTKLSDWQALAKVSNSFSLRSLSYIFSFLSISSCFVMR